MDEQRATGNLEEIGRRDHEITSEYRLFGPPGTGKTTNITRQIRRAVDKFGAQNILVTSFSRAAAAELAGRDLPIERNRIGTLHSICWHALGGPEIAEANVEDWNKSNPALAITPVKKQHRLDGEGGEDADDSDAEKGGDLLLQRAGRFRGQMIEPQWWPQNLHAFHKKWTAYKEANGLVDFTDLIETCLRDVFTAPGHPEVIFADEAQDLNRMQLSLVRKWGERSSYFIVAGDDDQTIYSFAGASPEAFLDPDIPDDHKIILKQSFRVPRAVHSFAEKLIHRVGRRQAKDYFPRDAAGALDRLSTGGYKSADYLILKTALAHVERGQSVMFLAACSYMLRPVIATLRKHGVPFHNPYRKSNGFWNPLASNGTTTASRITSLLIGHPDYGDAHRAWTHGDLAAWADVLQVKGVLRRGVKQKLKEYDQRLPVTLERLDDLFEPSALESLMVAWEAGRGALLDWWRLRLATSVADRAKFPIEIATRRGPRALVEPPKVVVGTIHSVKGGQADVVYLFPDLSQAGDAQYARGGAARDSVIRLFYVGATRAYEKLVVCQRESALAISL